MKPAQKLSPCGFGDFCFFVDGEQRRLLPLTADAFQSFACGILKQRLYAELRVLEAEVIPRLRGKAKKKCMKAA
jgi:hypothetical protein